MHLFHVRGVDNDQALDIHQSPALDSALISPDAVAGIRIADGSALLKLFINPELYFGEAHGDGSIEVDGDLVKLLEAAYRGTEHASFSWRLRRLVASLDRPRSNALGAARDNGRVGVTMRLIPGVIDAFDTHAGMPS